jgi:prepilin-type N-terminal cleavage/methylation domain-containing protein
MRALLPASAGRRARGFTLAELMVSLAVVAIVMVGVAGALLGNQRQIVSQASTTSMQASLRIASVQLERALLRAGYGIDPNLALEPRVINADGTEGNARDNSGPDSSDELVVQYADPGFRRELTNVGTAGFTLDRALPAGDGLPAGQRMLVLCANAADAAYVTVASYDANSKTVALDASAAPPFNQQDKLASGCFTSSGAIARRIERRHFFIAWFAEPNGTSRRPALMVRRGVDVDGDGTVDEAPDGWPDNPVPAGGSAQDAELVALDVEQLQVAYVMNRPSPALEADYGLADGPDADKSFVFGDSNPPDAPSASAPVWSGTTSAPAPLGPPMLGDPNCSALIDSISHCGYGGRRRFTGHPGNVRSVRFTVAARGAHEEQELKETTVENRGRGETASAEELIEDKPASGDEMLSRHRRQRMSGAVSLRNVFQRKHFVPPAENVDGG